MITLSGNFNVVAIKKKFINSKEYAGLVLLSYDEDSDTTVSSEVWLPIEMVEENITAITDISDVDFTLEINV